MEGVLAEGSGGGGIGNSIEAQDSSAAGLGNEGRNLSLINWQL